MADESGTEPANREDPQIQREDQDEHQAHPYGRHGETDERNRPDRMIACAVGSSRGEGSERNAHEIDERGPHDQKPRTWNKSRADRLGNRLVVGQRGPEIATEQTAEVVQHLYGERPVERPRMMELLNLLGRRMRTKNRDR